MKNQPNRDYTSNDVVQTPTRLARLIVEHFQPEGKILEPCRGKGNFFLALPEADWCEIAEGKDFFDCANKYDWIVTNPPWSQIKNFLEHAMKIADNIVFLITINHLWTTARIRLIQDYNFGIKEICMTGMPPTFPQSGFQLGAIHLKRGYIGKITLSEI